jgi:hypothetical protein
VIAHANGVRRNVGVKDGAEHPAMRRYFRIVARKRNLDNVLPSRDDCVILLFQTAHVVFQLVLLGRIPPRFDQTDSGLLAEHVAQILEVGLQSAKP